MEQEQPEFGRMHRPTDEDVDQAIENGDAARMRELVQAIWDQQQTFGPDPSGLNEIPLLRRLDRLGEALGNDDEVFVKNREAIRESLKGSSIRFVGMYDEELATDEKPAD